MAIEIAGLAAAIGYLVGSVSFAKLILRLVSPGADFGPSQQQVPGTDFVFETDSVSAMTVRMKLGPRYGCLTGILDILKAVVPTLCFRLWVPDASYHLLCATAVVAGHNWPLFNRFKGGRGLSTITGGLIAIDPLGLAAAIAGAWILALCVGHLLIMRWGWMLLMIPWFWLAKDDWAYVLYILAVNTMFWFSMRKELQQYLEVARSGHAPSQEKMTSFMGAGRALGRFMDRYSLLALLKRRQEGTRSTSGLIDGWTVLVIETDEDGYLEWSDGFGEAGVEVGTSVALCDDGGYVVSAYVHSYGTGGADDSGFIVCGLTESYRLGSLDMYVIKTGRRRRGFSAPTP